jgi:hypothetical protein
VVLWLLSTNFHDVLLLVAIVIYLCSLQWPCRQHFLRTAWTLAPRALRWVPVDGLPVYGFTADIGRVVVVEEVPCLVHKHYVADFALLVTALAGRVRTVGIAVFVVVHIPVPAAFALGWEQRVAVNLMRERDLLSVGCEGVMEFLSTLATDWRMHCWHVLSSSSTSSASRLKSRPVVALRADPQDGCGVQLSKIATHVLSTAAILNAV